MSENQLEISHSPEVTEIIKALSAAQAKIGKAELNCENEHLKSRYADLSSVWAACQGPLTENGMCVTAIPVRVANGGWELITTLWHTSGQWMRATLPLIMQKNDMQGLGSALTYGRRYSLGAMVGVTQEDDDGERSINRGKASERPAGNNAQNANKNSGPNPNAAQNVQKSGPAPAKPVQPVQKPASALAGTTFAEGSPSLKRARGVIVKEIMAIASALGVGQDLVPPDEMLGLANYGQRMFNLPLEQLTEDQLEKMLEALNADKRGK